MSTRKKDDLGDLVWVHHSKVEHPAFLVKGKDTSREVDGVQFTLIKWESTREQEWVREKDIQKVQEVFNSRRSRRTPTEATKALECRVKKEVGVKESKWKARAKKRESTTAAKTQEPPRPRKKSARESADGTPSSKRPKEPPMKQIEVTKESKQKSEAKKPEPATAEKMQDASPVRRRKKSARESVGGTPLMEKRLEAAKESKWKAKTKEPDSATSEEMEEPPVPRRKCARKSASRIPPSKRHKGPLKEEMIEAKVERLATQKQTAGSPPGPPESIRTSEIGDFVCVQGRRLNEKFRIVGESFCKSHPRLLQLQLWDDERPPEYFYVPETDVVEQQPSFSERADSLADESEEQDINTDSEQDVINTDADQDTDEDDTTNEDVSDEPSLEEIRAKTTEMFQQAFNTETTIGQLIRSIQRHFGLYDSTNRGIIKERIRELIESAGVQNQVR